MFVNSDFSDLLRILNAHDVKYLVIGGYAVAQSLYNFWNMFYWDIHSKYCWILVSRAQQESREKVIE